MHFSNILSLMMISFSLSGATKLRFQVDWIYQTWQLLTGENPTQLGAQVYSKTINYEIPCGENKGKYANRIVGGQPGEKGEFPWLVSLQKYVNPAYRHHCGGAIVNSSWVLTAAHCVSDMHASQLRVVAGEYDLNKEEGHEQKRTVARIITNRFKPATFHRDIALLQLGEPLALNAEYVAPICLPQGLETFDDTVVVAGWGRLQEGGLLPPILQKVALALLTDEECDNVYGGTQFAKYRSKCQLCTSSAMERKDACQGDSGGPLMCYNTHDAKVYVCGIVSWGIGCAQPEYPGAYTQVQCYTGWIMGQMNE